MSNPDIQRTATVADGVTVDKRHLDEISQVCAKKAAQATASNNPAYTPGTDSGGCLPAFLERRSHRKDAQRAHQAEAVVPHHGLG